MISFVLLSLVLVLVGNLLLLRHFHIRTRELVRSEQRYRRLFEGNALCLCELDLSDAILALQDLEMKNSEGVSNLVEHNPVILPEIGGRIKMITANRSTLCLFEVDSIEELADRLPNLLTPTSIDSFKKWLCAVQTRESRFSDETEFLTCNGKTIRTLITFPMPGDEMEASQVPVSLLDITQQQQTEKQLSQVIQGASLGFWDWELESGRHYVNDRWLAMLGLGREDIDNDISDWSSRIHPEDRKRIEPLVVEHIKQGLPYVVEFRMRHKNGHWVWIQGSGNGVEYAPESHTPIRACGTHQDITERRRSEEALHTLVETMVGFSGNDFFHKVIRELCQWLDADGATIGEILGDDSFRSLATVIDGEVVENYQRPLRGTPCESVLKNLKGMFPEGVQQHFPQVKEICDFDLEGYVGTAVQDQ